MEIFLTYGLLVLFALGLTVMIFVVVSDPDKSPSAEQAAKMPLSTHVMSDIIAYGVITVLLAFFCFVTVLLHKSRS